jgi:transcriptional regulator with XRE-family HTH domain
MGKLDVQARERLRTWQKASGLTQHEFGAAIGRNDAWVSRYFDEAYDADLDTLADMARAVGHTLNELLDAFPSDKEGALLTAYRELPPSSRELLLRQAEHWAGLARAKSRARKRSLG